LPNCSPAPKAVGPSEHGVPIGFRGHPGKKRRNRPKDANLVPQEEAMGCRNRFVGRRLATELRDRIGRWVGRLIVTAMIGLLLCTCPSCRALAANPPGETQRTVEPAGNNHASPETSIRLHASAWGEESHGLRCRVKVPVEIEQGMPLGVTVELGCDPDKLDAGVKRLDAFLPAAFMELSLSDRQSGKTFTVQPYDPTQGMPAFDSGEHAAPLDGTAIEPWTVAFPLARVYETLQPGSYRCRVRYSFPDRPTRFRHGKPEGWDAAGFWHGTVVSGTFDLKVVPETPKTTTLLLPKRLRVEKELVQLRADDEKKTAVPAIRFRPKDAEKVTVPVRNGYFLAAKYYRNGEFYMLTAPPKPDDPNDVDAWYDYHGGDRQATYTIEVFETRDPPVHMWHPAPGSGGYKVLWKKTFPVSLSAGEFAKM